MSGEAKAPQRRRESFDSVACLYDAYRPRYPAEVLADVFGSAHIRETSRVLEIGCGTGQLSVPLAERCLELVAVELGPSLAALARRNLSRFPNARVETAAFEEWSLPAEAFGAVVCATAFHWLDPEVRFSKSAQALRRGGALVIVHPHQVTGGTPGFFPDSQKYYVKWGLSDDPFFAPTAPVDAPVMYEDLEHRSEFTSVQRHRFEAPLRFTSTSYVGNLETDSLVLGLAEDARRGFLADIAHLIDSRYGGEVSRNYLYEVVVAKKPT
jgi:SAM-dependent methyltransferase